MAVLFTCPTIICRKEMPSLCRYGRRTANVYASSGRDGGITHLAAVGVILAEEP